MTDIVAELERFVSLRGDTYSSAEVVGMVSRAAAEIERLRAALTKINEAAEKGKPTDKLLNWISHIADEAVNARAVD